MVKKPSRPSLLAALNAQLPSHVEQAARSNEDLAFAFQSEGAPLQVIPSFAEDMLPRIERTYRTHHKAMQNAQLIERLMALFVGQVMVNVHGCKWAVYPGRHYSYSPFVVQLPSAERFLDPTLFCTRLIEKQVEGSQSCTALATFVAKRERLAQP